MLGLTNDPSYSVVNIPNRAPYYLIYHFFFAYVVLSTRGTKNYYGIDHNSNPRSDTTVYGERAVKEGKMTQQQLKFLQRNEACHANSMEHFPVFAAATLFATTSGVAAQQVNIGCAVYTIARLVYAAAYLKIERGSLTYIRSAAWWVGNISCFYLLWRAGTVLNGGR